MTADEGKMKNEYKVTKELMLSWSKGWQWQSNGALALFGFWCATGIFGIGVLIYLALARGALPGYAVGGLMVVIAAYELFFSHFLAASSRYNALSAEYGVEEWIRTTEFTDEQILLTDHTRETVFRYEDITDIRENGEIALIFFQNNATLRIYKNAFIEGSWAECIKKISTILKA